MPTELTDPATADFIRGRTGLAPVGFVPEVRLHLADEAISLWQETEDAAGQIELPPPFWAFAWAGGQALARHLLDRPELVHGKRVFDLASGSGIVAIAAVLAGAARVTANEIDPLATAAIALNAAANGVDVRIIFGDVLDAGGAVGGPASGTAAAAAEPVDPDSMDADILDADVVLAGDVFYSKPMADRVLPFLRRAQRRGATVLVGDPGRAYLPQSRLIELAVYQVPVPLALEDAEVKQTRVWQLAPVGTPPESRRGGAESPRPEPGGPHILGG